MSAPTMTIAPDAVVAAAAAHAAEPLVPAAHWPALRRLAAPLPACATSVGFECRLLGAQAVDLGASVAPPAGAAVLAAALTDHRAAALLAVHPVWARLRDFARAWTAAGATLPRRVPFLFLELDGGPPAAPPPAPVPAVFLGLDWLVAELDARSPAARAGWDEVIAAAEALRGAPFDAPTRQAGERAFAALADDGVLLHAGVMTSRPGAALRLSVLVPRQRCADYLAAIGHAADAAAVADAAAQFGPLGGAPRPDSHLQLDFDAAGADRRIGVTLRPDDYRHWPALLARLIAGGLCEASRGSALLAWSGRAPLAGDAALPPRRLERTIEHVKLVCVDARLVGAKAYFGATPRPAPAAPAGR